MSERVDLEHCPRRGDENFCRVVQALGVCLRREPDLADEFTTIDADGVRVHENCEAPLADDGAAPPPAAPQRRLPALPGVLRFERAD